MTEINKRMLTGSGLVILVVVAVWLGFYSFTVLLLVINVLSLNEFYRLLETPAAQPSKTAGSILSISLIFSSLATLGGLVSWQCLLLNIPVAFGIFVAALYRPVTPSFQGLAITFLGIAVITLPVCFFATLPFQPSFTGRYYFGIPIGVFLLLWTNDTMAYLVGRRFGKHPLFLRISPKKTWEGSIGGAAAALVTGYMLSRYVTILNLQEWEFLCLIIVVTGTYGDLIKALLKRSLSVKDSGTILPGHGGMLDRFDSLLGSAPFVFIYLIYLGNES
jgi:phosphatidate cytidylyltransferase